MANEQLIATYSAHTVHINRVAAGLGNDVVPYIEAINQGVAEIFAKYQNRKRITPELQQQITEQANAVTRQQLQAYTAYLKSQNREMGGIEAEFAATTLEQVVINEDFEPATPSAAQVNAVAIASPIKLSENNFITYNSMMRNYWQKYSDEMDAVIAQGFIQGQTIQEIQSAVMEQIVPSKTGTTPTMLDRARRQARTIAITGTNHYANQARVAFVDDNEEVIKGYEFVAVLDSRTSQQCRSLDGRFFAKDDPKLSQFTPPLHPNCRSALVYSVDERYTIEDENSQRSSRFRVDGELDPKPVSSKQTYYEAMRKLSAADQDAILGPTLGKAFRKLNSPDEFAKLTIDSLGNPLTITEMKARDNELSRILNNQGS